jgi:hypothetical protein
VLDAYLGMAATLIDSSGWNFALAALVEHAGKRRDETKRRRSANDKG